MDAVPPPPAWALQERCTPFAPLYRTVDMDPLYWRWLRTRDTPAGAPVLADGTPAHPVPPDPPLYRTK